MLGWGVCPGAPSLAARGPDERRQVSVWVRAAPKRSPSAVAIGLSVSPPFASPSVSEATEELAYAYAYFNLSIIGTHLPNLSGKPPHTPLRAGCSRSLPMKGVAFPPFPRASLPLKRQRAQPGELARVHASLLSYFFVLVVLLPWSSIAVEQETEKLIKNASVAPTLDGTLSQSASQRTLPRRRSQSTLPAASFGDYTLPNRSFSVATLPSRMLTNTLPLQGGASTLSHTTSRYGMFEPASHPPPVFSTHGGWRASKGDYRGKKKLRSATGIKAAATAHNGTHVVDILQDADAASLPAMKDTLPAAMYAGLSSGLMASMPALGNAGQGTLNLSDLRYSLAPVLRTVPIDSLPPHLSPALCWANDKYGRFQAKPWYCSLICRLMARKVAEKEAAKYRSWKKALRSSSVSSSASTGEWFNSAEFRRLAKAVLDASTRSPVVVFTKGHCRFCKDAIKLLQDIGVKQIYVVDLGRAPDMLKVQLVLEKLTGARTVPRIYIGGVCIGGLSDMTKEHENGTLKQRLKTASAL